MLRPNRGYLPHVFMLKQEQPACDRDACVREAFEKVRLSHGVKHK
jgi:hypothetical protein